MRCEWKIRNESIVGLLFHLFPKSSGKFSGIFFHSRLIRLVKKKIVRDHHQQLCKEMQLKRVENLVEINVEALFV